MIKFVSRFWTRYRRLRRAGRNYHGRFDKMRQNGLYSLVCDPSSGCPIYINFKL